MRRRRPVVSIFHGQDARGTRSSWPGRDCPEVADWTPNMLRHAAGDAARDAMALDAAQAMLGHRHASTTEIYAKVRPQKARAVAAKIG